MNTLIIILLFILSFFICLYKKGALSRHFIYCNKFLFSKYVFRLLIFCFGLLTFIYGINDSAIVFRENNKIFEDNNLAPFINLCNLDIESNFIDSGYIYTSKIVLDSVRKDLHYIFFTDLTGSVSDAMNLHLAHYLRQKITNKNDSHFKEITKLRGAALLTTALVDELNNYSSLKKPKLKLQAYLGNSTNYNKGSESIVSNNWIEINKYNQNQFIPEMINYFSKIKGIGLRSNTYFNEIYDRISDLIENDSINNLNIVIISDFVAEHDGTTTQTNDYDELTSSILRLSNLVSQKNCKISLVELPSKISKDTMAFKSYSLLNVKDLISQIPSSNFYRWNQLNAENINISSTQVYLNHIITTPHEADNVLFYNATKDLNEVIRKISDRDYYCINQECDSEEFSVFHDMMINKIVSKNELNTQVNSNHNKNINYEFVSNDKCHSESIYLNPLQPLTKNSLRTIFVLYSIIIFGIFNLAIFYVVTLIKLRVSTKDIQIKSSIIWAIIMLFLMLTLIITFLIINVISPCLGNSISSHGLISLILVGAVLLLPCFYYKFEL